LQYSAAWQCRLDVRIPDGVRDHTRNCHPSSTPELYDSTIAGFHLCSCAHALNLFHSGRVPHPPPLSKARSLGSFISEPPTPPPTTASTVLYIPAAAILRFRSYHSILLIFWNDSIWVFPLDFPSLAPDKEVEGPGDGARVDLTRSVTLAWRVLSGSIWPDFYSVYPYCMFPIRTFFLALLRQDIARGSVGCGATEVLYMYQYRVSIYQS
jgi:hypothetical protein